MSISVVRSYLKSRISDEDSGFYEHTDGFSTGNIPTNIKSKSYFIEYQQPSNISTEGNVVLDQVTATVRLYFKGYRSVQQSIDSSMDTAHNIKLRASNISNYSSTIKRCVGTSVTIEPASTDNDNSMVVTLGFDLEIYYNVI